MKRSALVLSTLFASGLVAFAQTNGTDQILQVAGATWPGPHNVGIVCDYSRSKGAVDAMIESFPLGSRIYVADIRQSSHVTSACSVLGKLRPQYVLLLPKDLLVHDGSFNATLVISNMNRRQIPTLGTLPVALSQGAWAVMGPATGNMLQVNPTLKEYIETYGAPISPSRPIAKAREGQARSSLSVIAAY
ncbi:MAG: hypothetical protein IPQ13_01180 [Holophagaceae bacterium]|nr:hypothetical protein [Holophagaceae bacterium]